MLDTGATSLALVPGLTNIFQNGVAGKQLTVYPRADASVRLGDNKVLLGAHAIEMGNTIQRYIPTRRDKHLTGTGWWSTVKWDSAIPVRKGYTIILRYAGVSDLPDWQDLVR
jgi:hypothetical protein